MLMALLSEDVVRMNPSCSKYRRREASPNRANIVGICGHPVCVLILRTTAILAGGLLRGCETNLPGLLVFKVNVYNLMFVFLYLQETQRKTGNARRIWYIYRE